MTCTDAEYWGLVANLSLGLGYAVLGAGLIWRWHRWIRLINDYEAICTRLLDDNKKLAHKVHKAVAERDAWEKKATG